MRKTKTISTLGGPATESPEMMLQKLIGAGVNILQRA